MAVLAIFNYDIQPGRMNDFMAKLGAAGDTVPGPDTGPVVLMIEHENMAAYGARTDYEPIFW
jgi:hypothetical protein